jgi:hypothetical protein
VVHADHPAVRGMLQQVRHLVEVTVDANPAAMRRGTAATPRGKKSDAKS